MGSAASPGNPMEALEDLRQLIGRDAGAGIADSEFEVRAGVAQFHFDDALESELEGVRDEIENDLFPHPTIDIRRLEHWRTVDVEPQSSLLDGGAKHARKIRGESRKIHRLVLRLNSPRFEAGKIEQ